MTSFSGSHLIENTGFSPSSGDIRHGGNVPPPRADMSPPSKSDKNKKGLSDRHSFSMVGAKGLLSNKWVKEDVERLLA